jgi:hypothetical protein
MSIQSIEKKYPNAVWYDSNHGGSNAGTLANPYTSLATAMTNATDSVAVLNGTHTENVSIAVPKSLVFVGESLSAVLSTTQSGATYGDGMQCAGFNVTLETLTFLNNGTSVITVIDPGAGGNLTIESCHMEYGSFVLNYANHWGLIGGSVAGNLTIKNSTFKTGARSRGIIIGGDGNTGQTFVNSTIEGNTFVIITGSTATDISRPTAYTSSIWKNNIFIGLNGTEVLNMTPSTYKNNCFNNTGETSGGTDNLFETDPLFVDSANGDYRLRPTSPCINAGTAS